jgi:hypothetical protein
MKDKLLSEDLKRIAFLINHKSGKLVYETKTDGGFIINEKKINNITYSKKLLNEQSAPANVWADLKKKLDANKPSTLTVGLTKDGYYAVRGYSGGRTLGFYKDGRVKFWNGKTWSKGGKWVFSNAKNGVLSGAWLLDDKGKNVSLKDGLNYAAKYFSSDQNSGGPSKWDRQTSGDQGYWQILFDQLKKGGIGVKLEKPNDSVASTYMYWGGWVVFKDYKTNGGYNVTFNGSNASAGFKFSPTGYYSGQPLENIILSVRNAGDTTVKLSDVGKLSNVEVANYISNVKTNAADAKKKLEAQEWALAKQIANEIDAAFDQDNDGVHNDYDGTSEKGAAAAFNKITSRGVLDKVDSIIKGWGYYKNSRAWLDDEMSDYDPEEYRNIWGRLEKLGYAQPKVNYLYRAGGIAADVTGVKTAQNLIESVKNMKLDDIMNAVRDFLNGTAGAIITTVLDVTGIGKLATASIWGIILAYDGYKLASEAFKPLNLFNAIGSLLGILTSGGVAKSFGAAVKKFTGGGGTLSQTMQKLSQQTWFKKTLGPVISVVASGIKSVGKFITKAVGWLSNKLGLTWLGTKVKGITDWLEKLGGELVAKVAPKASEKMQKEVGKTLATKVVIDPTKKNTKEYTARGTEQITGSKGAGDIVRIGSGVRDTYKTGAKFNTDKKLNVGPKSDINKPTADYYQDYYKTYGKNLGKTVGSTTGVATTTDKAIDNQNKKEPEIKTTTAKA